MRQWHQPIAPFCFLTTLRVDNNAFDVVLIHFKTNGFHHVPAPQHARFNDISANIRHDCVDLLTDKRRRYIEYGVHAQGILGGQGRNDRCYISSQGGNCFNIRLYACPTACIRTGN